MRLILAVTLATGLLLVGLGVYDAQRALSGTTATCTALDDGTGFPPPHPAR